MTTHIGLIGGGNITQTHARAARAIPGVEISAIQGTNSEKIARLCREHGGTSYQDFDAFLKHRPMDLVLIGSPSGLHATQGIAAARQGLHVLTEKPIEINTARADALIWKLAHRPLRSPPPPPPAYPASPPRLKIPGPKAPVIPEQARITPANPRTPPPPVESAALAETQSASPAVVSDFRGHQAVL